MWRKLSRDATNHGNASGRRRGGLGVRPLPFKYGVGKLI
jgi:hypothetical protein